MYFLYFLQWQNLHYYCEFNETFSVMRQMFCVVCEYNDTFKGHIWDHTSIDTLMELITDLSHKNSSLNNYIAAETFI